MNKMYFVCGMLLVLSVFGILLNINGITGNVILEETEIRNEFGFVEPDKVSRSGALDSLIEAKDDIDEMEGSVLFVNDLLLDAKRNFIGEDLGELKEEVKIAVGLKKDHLEGLLRIGKETPSYDVKKQNYKEVFRLTQLIKFKKNQVFSIIDTISLVESKEEDYRKDKIDTSEGLGILEEAKKSFEEERYDEAEAFLKEADLRLDKASSESKRLKGLINLSKGFFVKYWWVILGLIVLGVIFGPGVVKKVRKKLAKKKLLELRMELQTLNRLIKKAQEDRFKLKKLTKASYGIRVDRYKKRMTEIKHTIPVLEGILGKKVKKKVKKRGVLEIK